jgi:glycosyltransferase involved in cell wall biosynthesis
VVTVHDLCWLLAPQTMRRSTRFLDKLLMPMALQRAQAVIAVSTATRDALADHFPGIAHKLHLVHAGVSPLPEPLLSMPDGRPAAVQWGIHGAYVLFVGTMEPRKNLLCLLQAFARVVQHGEANRQMGPDPEDVLRLVLVGAQGWGADKLQQTIAELGLKDRVSILGRVPDQKLATLYRHALCLAMPSLYEGFGLPLVEAMAQGTPVLTSNTSSMPEVAGAAGLLVDPLDVDSIAAGLRDMVFKPGLRAQLASHAREQAQLFSWDRAAEQTLDVLLGSADARLQRCQVTAVGAPNTKPWSPACSAPRSPKS